jgi:methyl-accepting chemotaxis protein
VVAAEVKSLANQTAKATDEISSHIAGMQHATQEPVTAINITQVNRGATETGSASEEVLNSAQTLSTESTRLRQELDRFMTTIWAA